MKLVVVSHNNAKTYKMIIRPLTSLEKNLNKCEQHEGAHKTMIKRTNLQDIIFPYLIPFLSYLLLFSIFMFITCVFPLLSLFVELTPHPYPSFSILKGEKNKNSTCICRCYCVLCSFVQSFADK